jgi:hypothetical protein
LTKEYGKKMCFSSDGKTDCLTRGLIMLIALVGENILGHQLVDGWTRWVACAYSGAGERQTQNSKA